MEGRKQLTLSVAVLAGACIALAPAVMAQTRPDKEDASKSGKSGSSSAPMGSDSKSGTQPGSPSVGGSSSATEQKGGAAGSQGMGRSSTGSEHKGGMAGGATESKGNVKQIQEALKKEGFDPGPADGVMGQKTSDALKQFQQKKNLKATGRIDAETAQQLGVEQGAAGSTDKPGQKSGARSSEGSGGTGQGSSGIGSGGTGAGSSGKSGSGSPSPGSGSTR